MPRPRSACRNSFFEIWPLRSASQSWKRSITRTAFFLIARASVVSIRDLKDVSSSPSCCFTAPDGSMVATAAFSTTLAKCCACCSVSPTLRASAAAASAAA